MDFAHTFNKGLDANSLNQLLSLARKLVGHFKHSALATAALRQKQEQMNVPKHHLIQDVVTRWNSTFLMFQRLVEQGLGFMLFCMMNVAHKANINICT